MRVILATISPYKREVLERTGLVFESMGSDFDEDMAQALDPDDLARELALGKARAVAAKHPDATVIGTDVFCEFNGNVLGKPKDAEDAFRMLESYKGNAVKVICGLAVVSGKKELTHVEYGEILFRDDMTDAEIRAYVATGEPLTCSGSFNQERLGACLIAEERGDHNAIVGVPTYKTLELLRKFGVNPLK